MQTYDPARRSPQQSAIPAMRHAPERTGRPSATPIYDALYAEYRMMFRTLPGDRSGEEDLGFKAFAAFSGLTGFATGLHGTGPYQAGQAGAAAGGGFHGPKRELRQLPGPPAPGPGQAAQPPPVAHPGPHPGLPAASQGPPQHERMGGYQTGTWRYGGRPHGPGDLLPAVLPARRQNGR